MACKLLFSFPDQCPRHHDGCRAGVCHPAQHHRETAVWPGALSCLQMSCSNNFSNEVSHFYCFLRSVLLNWDGAVRFILLCFLISDVKIMMCILPPYIRTMEAVDAGASLMEMFAIDIFRIFLNKVCSNVLSWLSVAKVTLKVYSNTIKNLNSKYRLLQRALREMPAVTDTDVRLLTPKE